MADYVVVRTAAGERLSPLSFHYGVSWNEVLDTYVRTGSLAGQPVSQTLSNALLPIQAAMRRCILNDAGEVQYYLHATDSTKREDGVLDSDLTGGDGQVMVQIPKFYYRYGYASTTHTWEISLFPQDGFSVHPAFIKNGVVVDYRYYSAYEGVGYDASAAAYIDSGCVAATNWSGTNGYHAVLLVDTDRGTFVLDNRQKAVWSFDELPYKWDKRECGDGIWRKILS